MANALPGTTSPAQQVFCAITQGTQRFETPSRTMRASARWDEDFVLNIESGLEIVRVYLQ